MLNTRAISISRRVMVMGAVATMLPLKGAEAGRIAKTFSKHASRGGVTIDHSIWDRLLQDYVVASSDGINRIRYKAMKASGHGKLRAYIRALEVASVPDMTRPEQYAFWINLYNASTLDVVLSHYPVASIRDINLGGGLFTRGPWKKRIVKVRGSALSLDDIEHGILRPLWRDARIHYAVNCASLGCPNLQRRAFTAGQIEKQLTRAARDYVNHPRGVTISSSGITASKIYDWYGKDFGGRRGLPAHWRRYGKAPLIKALSTKRPITGFAYDWRLNAT